jgi:hypothetical protein
VRGGRIGRAGVAIAATICAVAPAAAYAGGPTLGPAIKLDKSAAGFTEPRVAITSDDHRFVITNDNDTSDAVVYSSVFPGNSWTRTPAEPSGQTAATADVDIVSTKPFAGAPNGRLVAAELDDAGINFRVSYSDNEGKSWTTSSGATLGDTDRQWLAAGPPDPTTGLPRVYLLFHNLASGSASHNMYVQTSTDGGASFAPPVPITLPPSQAWQDLQCADSGGPSDLFVNQKTGRVYAVWGTRTAPLAGGCGASVFGPFEINVVGATRVWIASSADGSSWNDVLAVNASGGNGGKGQLVGMQLAPGALDNQGNVYVVYPESPNAYPDYSGAAIKYIWAPADLSKWSAPVTVAPAGGAGHVLPHIVAGDPGKLDLAYYTGETRVGRNPAWYMTVAQVLKGQTTSPQITERRLSSLPTYTGTASDLMGACDHDATDPTAGVVNGFECDRSSDVWGVTLDSACRLVTTWHLSGDTTLNDADPQNGGSYVATQTGGTTVCKKL